MHSRLMVPVRDRLAELIGSVRRRPPEIPILSNRTGEPLTAQQATDPGYWGDHMCSTVRLADGVRALAGQDVAAVVDLGAGQLASLATQVLSAMPGGAGTPGAIGSLPPAYRRGTEREVLLRAAARLWEVGAPVDWSRLSRPGGRLTALPEYPFDRRRFWPGQLRPRAGGAPGAMTGTAPGETPGTTPGIQLYAPAWEQAPAQDIAGEPTGPVLLLTDDEELGGALAAGLAPACCVRVRSGPGFAESGDLFTVRPAEAADYQQLLARLGATGRLPRSVIHLWLAASGTGADGTADLIATARADHEAGFSSLLALGKTLPHHVPEGARLLIVTTGASATRPGEPVRPGRGTIAGLALTLPQEHPGMAVRTLDFTYREDGTAGSRAAELAGHVVRELSWPGAEATVAIRDGGRLVRRYRPAARQDARRGDGQVTLRQHGVYVITGGLGRVGLLIAADLAKQARIRLVLTSRQGLPPRESWTALLAGEEDQAVRRIRAVMAIEALGAEVMTAALDVGDAAAVRDLVDAARGRFGPVNGVIHAAGTTDPASFAPIADLGPGGVDAHLVPKVYGTLALDAALAGTSLDFCVAMSSLSSVLGGVAFSGYAAANAFLDLLADSAGGYQRWTAINWDTWQSTVEDHALGELRQTTLDRYSIAPEQCTGLLREMLDGGRPRVIVAAADLDERVRQWAMPSDPFRATASGAATGPDTGPAGDRPDLAVPYVGPRTAAERRIAGLWSEAMGIQQIGVNDNFFDLGGNSLVGMQLVNSLTREFGRSIPTVALFEAPTVAALAAYLDDAGADPAPCPAASPASADAGHQVGDGGEIAIIGMAGRFPGADDVRAFWQNLVDGVESVSFFSLDELLANGVPGHLLRSPGYVPARPVLSAVGEFDAEFFGYTPPGGEPRGSAAAALP